MDKDTAGNARKYLNYLYRFTFANGSEKEFRAVVDAGTLTLVQEAKAAYPAWTALGHCQCANCPLKAESQPHCPLAVSIADIVGFFKNSTSFEKVDVFFDDGIRTYTKRTSLEDGISSLIGIFMVTSGCPIMEKLKPMVRHHLPFATLEETRYRVISMYLTAQYFVLRQGGQPDWDLKGLTSIYNDVRIVNKSFSERVLNASVKDASVNALIRLDCFAIHVSFLLDKNTLGEMQSLFSSYIKDR